MLVSISVSISIVIQSLSNNWRKFSRPKTLKASCEAEPSNRSISNSNRNDRYFTTSFGSLTFITHADIENSKILKDVEGVIHLIRSTLKRLDYDEQAVRTDAFLELAPDAPSVNSSKKVAYYLVNHRKQTICWLEGHLNNAELVSQFPAGSSSK